MKNVADAIEYMSDMLSCNEKDTFRLINKAHNLLINEQRIDGHLNLCLDVDSRGCVTLPPWIESIKKSDSSAVTDIKGPWFSASDLVATGSSHKLLGTNFPTIKELSEPVKIVVFSTHNEEKSAAVNVQGHDEAGLPVNDAATVNKKSGIALQIDGSNVCGDPQAVESQCTYSRIFSINKGQTKGRIFVMAKFRQCGNTCYELLAVLEPNQTTVNYTRYQVACPSKCCRKVQVYVKMRHIPVMTTQDIMYIQDLELVRQAILLHRAQLSGDRAGVKTASDLLGRQLSSRQNNHDGNKIKIKPLKSNNIRSVR